MKHTTILSSCLLLALSAAVAFGGETAKTYKTFREANDAVRKLQDQKDYEQALKTCDIALSLATKPGEKRDALARKGEVYLSKGKSLPAAETNFLAAAAVKDLPGNLRAQTLQRLLSQCYRKQGKAGFEKGTNLLVTALADPAMSNAWGRASLVRDLAWLYFDNWEIDAAKKCLAEEAKKTNLSTQHDEMVASDQAKIFYKLYDLDNALKAYLANARNKKFNAGTRLWAFRSVVEILGLRNRNDEAIQIGKSLYGDETMKGQKNDISWEVAKVYLAKGDYQGARSYVQSLADPFSFICEIIFDIQGLALLFLAQLLLVLALFH